MKRPIYDFIREYAQSGAVRMHMPGHKGRGTAESLYDITEIRGADSLYEADGIIKESERNAGALFGAHTFYSTEGSSLSIRAMLYLAAQYASLNGKRARILYAGGAHKVFFSAAALIGFETLRLCSKKESYLCGGARAEELASYLDGCRDMPTAVYVTSPDYLGNLSEVKKIAEICHRRGILLCVDNAHGAYLKFLDSSLHPIDLGADIVCDSAHKTLPVLTGGAYLHISKNIDAFFCENAKAAMAMFGSTSPSYHILLSLDLANCYIAEKMKGELCAIIRHIETVKAKIMQHGYELCGDEPMKITIKPKAYGYTGDEIARILYDGNIEVEFSDPDHVVLMPSTYTAPDELDAVCESLCAIPRRAPISTTPPAICIAHRALSIRDASLAPGETVAAEAALGRVLQAITVGCPPAVPIVTPGEVIDGAAIDAFKYYGISTVKVVK